MGFADDAGDGFALLEPFEAEFFGGDREKEFAGGEVAGGGGMNGVFVRAGSEAAPFAGKEGFDFAINDFHGDGVLIGVPGETFFGDDGVGEGEERPEENGGGDDEFDAEGAER